MAKIEPFERHLSQYENWFKRNKFVFESELRAVREQLPKSNNGIEIGIGSGQFAQPLNIRLGIEPSKKMRELALKRGIKAIDGIAEKLPFNDAQYDFVLMVTTVCFVDDIEASFQETYRVLKLSGCLIIGFIDKDSPTGRLYQQHKNESVFYEVAIFYSVNEIIFHLRRAGFKNFSFTQTIFHDLTEIKNIEPIKEGYGKGSFVVIRAIK
jgi:ubiquinone/menaquinone biosynthesis C-methylase UbiE